MDNSYIKLMCKNRKFNKKNTPKHCAIEKKPIFAPIKTQTVTHKTKQICKKSADLREMKQHKQQH